MPLAKALPIAIAVSLAATIIAPAANARSPKRLAIDVTGTYASNWDDVSLVQDGNRVRGTYVCCGGGTIEGRIIEGTVIRYTWREPNGAGQGEGIWTIENDGRLDGTWGHGQSDSDGGAWNLVPKRKPTRIAR